MSKRTDKPAISQSQFARHLDRVSLVVSTWPVWKQTLLGGKAPKSEPILYRNRKGKVWVYNEWNSKIEVGDILVDCLDGSMYRAVQSSGRDKAAAGDLSIRRIKPPTPNHKAVLVDGKAWWVAK